ncbi:MAG: Gfo/Idh/MocA family oxidoreductase, partial [bacterium]|nr:Gfo/Idh/MocA family oxidoreductase [bacterium]
MSNEITRRTLLGGIGAAAAIGHARGAARKVRIGIVGGRFGASFQWHLHPDCEVAAVCDIQPAPLERLSKTYRCGNTYKDFREMLQHPGLDAVGVFTPAPLHAWMATEAMKAGKHVISAVPAAVTEDELVGLLETVRETGMKYMMAETSYYRPEIITCRDMAQAGEFGSIFYSEAEYHHEGLLALFYDDRRLPTWRHGFPPMLYPTHCTGMIVPVTGERLTAVQAIGWGDQHEV